MTRTQAKPKAALIHEVCLDDFVELTDHLRQGHFEEASGFQDVLRLDPDWKQYAAQEARNGVFFLVAQKDGKTCGYSVAFVMPHPQCRETVVGLVDAIYVAPEHRGGRVGRNLILATEVHASLRGAKILTWHEPSRVGKSKGIGSLLGKIGYEPHEVAYSRRL
jgi:GNAT superfamily N-acetyltransferase